MEQTGIGEIMAEPQKIQIRAPEIKRINLSEPDQEEIVQGFNYWMDGFWKVIAGCFRHKNEVQVQQHTFTEVGCQCIIPETEFPVQKTWFTLEQSSDTSKWNRANATWEEGQLIIHVDVESIPCTIKWFNIY